MIQVKGDKELQPSVLDRLLDDEPHITTETDKSRFQRLKQLRASVRRDLEHLLNARCRVISSPEHMPELEHCMLNYGLPDLATINTLDITKKKDFTRQIEKVIRAFEPRFKSVRVIPIDGEDKKDRSIRFRIDAVMHADPAPEIVVFDSVLEPVLRTVTVEDSH